MRACKVLTLAVFALFAVLSDAGAQMDRMSGKWIFDGCESQEQTYKSGICIGTIRTLLHVGRDLPPSHRFCMPAKKFEYSATPLEEALRLVRIYLEETYSSRQTRMNEEFVQLAVEALRRAWPCR